MAKRAGTSKKTLNAENLIGLGPARLAEILLQVAGGDANLKRRLRLELASSVGAPDLALEIDKRLAALAGSRTRVSWRKRPQLIDDLRVHLRMITDHLAPLDPRLAFDRMVLWFDLYPRLAARVKDPKGELSAFFFDAAPDLAAVAGLAQTDHVSDVLFEAAQTRSSHWVGWIGRAADELPRPVAQMLLERLTCDRPPPVGLTALLVRKLADRAGDVRAWISAIAPGDRQKPDVGAQIAERLVAVNAIAEARAALDSSRPRLARTSRWAQRIAPPAAEVSDAWEKAEIAVLDAEGRADAAQAARWAAFERTLSDAYLRDFTSRLGDFEDVEALDRAYAVAASWGDATKGLAFLMQRLALREAAEMAIARHAELNGLAEQTALWASRLAVRHPTAALALVRAEARALVKQGPEHDARVRELASEAAVLAEAADARLPSHADFIDELEALARSSPRRSRR